MNLKIVLIFILAVYSTSQPVYVEKQFTGKRFSRVSSRRYGSSGASGGSGETHYELFYEEY
jgi:hypothetical protein